MSHAARLVPLLLLASPGIARADDGVPTPWDRGSIAVSFGVASQEAFDEDYFHVGAGIGYFVADGLELGFDGAHWFGGDPGISLASPHVRYVAVPLGWPLLPYVGGFYAHYFIGDPFDDFDTIGGRFGALYHQGGGLVVGVGGAVERVVSDCNDDCTSIYPEVSIGFSF